MFSLTKSFGRLRVFLVTQLRLCFTLSQTTKTTGVSFTSPKFYIYLQAKRDADVEGLFTILDRCSPVGFLCSSSRTASGLAAHQENPRHRGFRLRCIFHGGNQSFHDFHRRIHYFSSMEMKFKFIRTSRRAVALAKLRKDITEPRNVN